MCVKVGVSIRLAISGTSGNVCIVSMTICKIQDQINQNESQLLPFASIFRDINVNIQRWPSNLPTSLGTDNFLWWPRYTSVLHWDSLAYTAFDFMGALFLTIILQFPVVFVKYVKTRPRKAVIGSIMAKSFREDFFSL